MLSEKFSKILIYSGIILIFICLIIFSYNEVFFDFTKTVKADKFGQLGDIIGGFIGSLWALAGVILFYSALRDQRIDIVNNQKALNAQIDALKIQAQEFQLQRKELVETRSVFKEQSKTLKLQQFEYTFFNMLNLHHQIINSIDFNEKRKEIPLESLEGLKVPPKNIAINHKGRGSFANLYNRYSKYYFRYEMLDIFDGQLEVISNSYRDFYDKFQAEIGHYFMNLYQIVQFVDTNSQSESQIYADLIQAQISCYEMLLLFYHCLHDENEQFKLFVEKYGLFSNLPLEDLINMKHIDLFNESAFN